MPLKKLQPFRWTESWGVVPSVSQGVGCRHRTEHRGAAGTGISPTAGQGVVIGEVGPLPACSAAVHCDRRALLLHAGRVSPLCSHGQVCRAGGRLHSLRH